MVILHVISHSSFFCISRSHIWLKVFHSWAHQDLTWCRILHLWSSYTWSRIFHLWSFYTWSHILHPCASQIFTCNEMFSTLEDIKILHATLHPPCLMVSHEILHSWRYQDFTCNVTFSFLEGLTWNSPLLTISGFHMQRYIPSYDVRLSKSDMRFSILDDLSDVRFLLMWDSPLLTIFLTWDFLWHEIFTSGFHMQRYILFSARAELTNCARFTFVHVMTWGLSSWPDLPDHILQFSFLWMRHIMFHSPLLYTSWAHTSHDFTYFWIIPWNQICQHEIYKNLTSTQFAFNFNIFQPHFSTIQTQFVFNFNTLQQHLSSI